MRAKIASKPQNESALARVMQMVNEVELQADAGPDLRNTGFPAHVASDADKFSEIFRRLDAIEKALSGRAR
jgi:hypothetical protein